MHVYKEGEKSKAICHHCEGVKETTMMVRDVPTDLGTDDIVKGVMVGVCDDCDAVVSMPHQSSIRLKEHLQDPKRSLEAVVPQHLIDGVRLCVHKLGHSGAEHLESAAVRYFVVRLAKGGAIEAYLKSQELEGKATARFSTKASPKLLAIMKELEEERGVSRSQQVRVAMLAMRLAILDNEDPEAMVDLDEYLSAY